MAHEFPRGTQLFLHERQRHLARGGVLECGKALRLCLLERLEYSRRQPRMRLHQLATDTGDMHDGKDAGAFEIISCRSNRIRKQPADMRIVLAGKAWHARGDEAIDLAVLQ